MMLAEPGFQECDAINRNLRMSMLFSCERYSLNRATPIVVASPTRNDCSITIAIFSPSVSASNAKMFLPHPPHLAFFKISVLES